MISCYPDNVSDDSYLSPAGNQSDNSTSRHGLDFCSLPALNPDRSPFTPSMSTKPYLCMEAEHQS